MVCWRTGGSGGCGRFRGGRGGGPGRGRRRGGSGVVGRLSCDAGWSLPGCGGSGGRSPRRRSVGVDGLLRSGNGALVGARCGDGLGCVRGVWVVVMRGGWETHIWEGIRMCALELIRVGALEETLAAALVVGSRLCVWRSKGGSLARPRQRDNICRGGCSTSRLWQTLGVGACPLPLPGSSWVVGTCAGGHSRAGGSSHRRSDLRDEFCLASSRPCEHKI